MKGGKSHFQTIVRRSTAERGQATAEYAIILAFVAAAAVASYQLFGDAVVALYDRVVSAF